MGEHTPVGWKQSERWESWIVTDDDEEMLIAQVNWSGATLTLAQWHAHARLLAAAPDLLAACELVFPTLCGLLMERWGADYDKPRDAQGYVAYAALKSAIAKAKGEEANCGTV